jgi:two-component sensor histidine kinase
MPGHLIDPDAAAPEGHLRALHEISMELSRSADVNALCRKAVELCVSRLGFDRIGIWLTDPEDPDWKVGTWGTDEEGYPRDESSSRIPRGEIDHRDELYDGRIPYVLVESGPAYDDRSRLVGTCAKAIAPLWDGEAIIGEIVADNLFSERQISEDEGAFLALFARTVAHLLVIKRGEAALKAALDANALLLRELKHRTKNSLTLVSSLISIESKRASDEQTKSTFAKLRDRVDVLISLYNQLDFSASDKSVRLDEYLRKLAEGLLEGYSSERRHVAIAYSLSPMQVDFSLALPIGLILNELVTDSLKYAFPDGRGGRISIELGPAKDGWSRFVVSDDGVGLPAGFSLQSGAGLGLGLVDSLCKQIEGELEARPSLPGRGARFSLRFRI